MRSVFLLLFVENGAYSFKVSALRSLCKSVFLKQFVFALSLYRNFTIFLSVFPLNRQNSLAHTERLGLFESAFPRKSKNTLTLAKNSLDQERLPQEFCVCALPE
jgi:hypothetical protein